MKHAETVQFNIANSDGNAVIAEAKSGDYDHLVQTIMEYSE